MSTVTHTTTARTGVLNIPDRPDLVTVLPFELAKGMWDSSAGKILVPAEVDGRRGIFLLDTGSPQVYLNDQYLAYTPSGGLDTILAGAHTTPPPAEGYEENFVHFNLHTICIGSLVHHFDTTHVEALGPFTTNAALMHDKRFQDFQRPLLGFLGATALAPFETIIDYAHRRLILIRLDAAGHRLIEVPAYPRVRTVPLVPTADGRHYGVTVHAGTIHGTMLLDTGDGINELTSSSREHLGGHLVPVLFSGISGVKWRLDSLRLGETTYTDVLIVSQALVGIEDHNVLGVPFFNSLGAVGFNFRTRQFLVYH